MAIVFRPSLILFRMGPIPTRHRRGEASRCSAELPLSRFWLPPPKSFAQRVWNRWSLRGPRPGVPLWPHQERAVELWSCGVLIKGWWLIWSVNMCKFYELELHGTGFTTWSASLRKQWKYDPNIFQCLVDIKLYKYSTVVCSKILSTGPMVQ